MGWVIWRIQKKRSEKCYWVLLMGAFKVVMADDISPFVCGVPDRMEGGLALPVQYTVIELELCIFT
jgi:hypothetical protein